MIITSFAFSSIMFLILFFCCYKFFRNKLLVLLLIELVMLYNIFFFCCWSHGKIFSIFFLIIFSAVMVLESILGVSILIMSSRDSTPGSCHIIPF